jgi:hypothetical protein
MILRYEGTRLATVRKWQRDHSSISRWMLSNRQLFVTVEVRRIYLRLAEELPGWMGQVWGHRSAPRGFKVSN